MEIWVFGVETVKPMVFKKTIPPPFHGPIELSIDHPKGMLACFRWYSSQELTF